MTAFSPPADSWIIRYPKKDTVNKEDMRKKVPESEQLEDPCRKYIDGSEIPIRSNKSLGTDDHFKSAVCSKNLLKVCEKLMTNKEFVSHSNDSADDDFGEVGIVCLWLSLIYNFIFVLAVSDEREKSHGFLSQKARAPTRLGVIAGLSQTGTQTSS